MRLPPKICENRNKEKLDMKTKWEKMMYHYNGIRCQSRYVNKIIKILHQTLCVKDSNNMMKCKMKIEYGDHSIYFKSNAPIIRYIVMRMCYPILSNVHYGACALRTPHCALCTT